MRKNSEAWELKQYMKKSKTRPRVTKTLDQILMARLPAKESAQALIRKYVPRKKVMKHRGKVSRNPLLMTVGNPVNKNDYFMVTTPSGEKVTIKGGSLRAFAVQEGIKLPEGLFSVTALLRRHGYKVESVVYRPYDSDIHYGNPCGGKKNPTVTEYLTRRKMKGRYKGFTGKALSDKKLKEMLRPRYSKSGKMIGLTSRAYAKNEAGMRPLIAGHRTVTIPTKKFEAVLYAKGTPSEISRYEAQKRAYTKAHLGTPPATVTRKIVDVGISKNITDRDFTYSMGKVPISTYTVPKGSGKAKQSLNWEHDWYEGTKNEASIPDQEVFYGGKVIMNTTRRGKKLVKGGWMV